MSYVNRKIFEYHKLLLESQSYPIDVLQSIQLEKLKELLKIASTQSHYYKDLFAKNKISVNDINSLDDLSKIPLITKPELLKNVDKIQIRPFPEPLIYSETSGSTGNPLVFYRNKDWEAWHNASVLRGYTWHGVDPWEYNGYFWGYNFDFIEQIKTKILDYLQNRFRLFSYSDEDINQFIAKLKNASYLEGYSSMIYEVARRINKKKEAHHFNLKLVKGTSEKIFDNYQAEAIKAFGLKITSEYGAAEAGIIAFECPLGQMHINMETVIVEELDNEIVVTNLVSKSFPIIRYKLGDYIKLNINSQCKCGMKHYILEEVVGRVGNVIYGKQNNYPSLTLYYVFKNLAKKYSLILNYQVIQRAKAKIEVNIEQQLSDEDKQLLNSEFLKYFKNDIEYILIPNGKIVRTGSKVKDFISLMEE